MFGCKVLYVVLAKGAIVNFFSPPLQQKTIEIYFLFFSKKVNRNISKCV